MPDLSPALASLADATSAIARAASGAAATASDDSLLAFQREVAASARLLEQAAATFAAEIAFRSRRELGYDGLAQRRGVRTPEALVQQVTGASSQSARRLVRVGTLVADLTAHDAGGSALARAGSGVDRPAHAPRPRRRGCVGWRAGFLLHADAPGAIDRQAPAAGN